MADLSTTAASNYPTGSDSPTSGDDYLRSIQAIIRSTNAKGADIASATTTNIGAATGEFVDVTGTTTITGLGTIAAGIVRTVRFTGALTLTHNATSLILPGSANITTANGDVAQFRSLGSGNWKCVGYIKADGTAVVIADNSITTAKIAFDGGALGYRNILINAGFRINNGNVGVPYVSAAVLASGEYGHEMWKAGASGGDYSFTQLNTNTQITIASGKSLIQVVEDKNVHETAYVLSWEGTAQARVGVNSATPSGTYASSPILITGQTAGTTMSVEFNAGTLGKAQLEKGTIATPFENRSYGQEQSLCERYFRTLTGIVGKIDGTNTNAVFATNFSPPLRTVPTVTFINNNQIHEMSITNRDISSIQGSSFSVFGGYVRFTMTTAGTSGNMCNISGNVFVSARL
jgi:hypothetical protein